MDKELKDKIQSLKVDAPVKKKKCTECKKKKQPITQLPEVVEVNWNDMYIPSEEDIRLSYIELGNKGKDKREFINKVYQYLFDEPYNFDCQSCVNVQSRKLKNYINNNFEVKVI